MRISHRSTRLLQLKDSSDNSATQRPATVYLDSSDFSILSDPKRRTPQLSKLTDDLISWVSEGAIVCRFSYVHVMEAAPIAREHIEAAQRRFSLMRRLCRGFCFVPPSVLLGEEVNRAYGQDASVAFARNDGRWFPSFKLGFPSLEELTRDSFREYPRAQRRALEKRLFRRDGTLRVEARSSMTTFLPLMLDKVARNFPLTPQAQDAVRRYLELGGSRDAMEEGILESIANLDSFGRWYVTQWDQTSALSSALRGAGTRIRDVLQELKDRISGLVARSGEHLTEAERKPLFDQQLPRWTAEMAEKLGRALGVMMRLEQPDLSWTLTPSLMTMCHLMFRVAWLTGASSRSSRTPKLSDFGDLAHSIYLPHVDIFRTDGFVADAIRQAGLPWNTEVVAKLEELGDRVAYRRDLNARNDGRTESTPMLLPRVQ